MRMTLVVALTFVVSAGPALAQMPAINFLDQGPPKSREDILRGQAIDQEYKSTMKKVPDQKKVNNDPWADVRGTSGQKQTGSVRKSN
jgi:hypothetical protein